MMTIQSSFQMFQSSLPQRTQHRHHHHQQPQVNYNPWAQLQQNCRAQDCNQQLGSIWASAMQPGGPPLSQPKEMNRNESAEVGPHTMKVDGQGNIEVATAPTQLSMGGQMNMGGCGQTSFAANLTKNEAPLKFSNGTVELPNGEKRPYGNTGIIVVMADGRQFAAGRNSKESKENIRYVAADKGQEIPVSPPGATTVLYLDAQGNVERQDVR